MKKPLEIEHDPNEFSDDPYPPKPPNERLTGWTWVGLTIFMTIMYGARNGWDWLLG